MRLRTLILVAAVGTGAWAAHVGGTAARTVTVCVSGESGTAVHVAEMRASQICSAIGVRIDWCANSCPASPDVIKVSFADEAPIRLAPNALAYALPYEGAHIVVLRDRVNLQSGTPPLLAFVLAHEIAHILQGGTWHSDTGIMKPYWNGVDYYDMVRNRLVFTAHDVELIHWGMDLRAARMAGEGLARTDTFQVLIAAMKSTGRLQGTTGFAARPYPL